MAGDDAIDALERRIATLEKRLGAADPAPKMRCARCEAVVPAGRFCAACGAILAPAPVPQQAPPPRPAPTTVIASRPPLAPPAPTTTLPSPMTASPAPRAPPKTAASVESMLGERWAPRIGAGLVFLGVVFFLGLAIQRGWIGPLAQLAIAVLAGIALLATGGWLTAQRGYGTYPQFLEGTGVSILYLTAFLAHALPYYERQTGLTELGSGLLMALVAVGTVALALWRDARIIAGLGYSLAFITALLGVETLPAITIPYVAILGTSLALLAARKAWTLEGLLGSFATGGLLLWLAYGSGADTMAVALVALAPAAAFLWLASRPASADTQAGPESAILVFLTLAWATAVTLAPSESMSAAGVILFTWSLVALAHAILSTRAPAHRLAIAASGISAVILWIIAAPLAWSSWGESELLVTATYALAALALGGFAMLSGTSSSRALWMGALTLIGAAAFYAVALQGVMRAPWEASSRTFGPWQAWLTLLLIAAPLALASTARDAPSATRRAAFWIAAVFGAMWTFALFGSALPATLWLVVVTATLVAVAIRAASDKEGLGASALAAALGVLALAALKIMFVDGRLPRVQVEATPAALQTLVVAGTMLALYHLARSRHLMRDDVDRFASGALVGGSAIVLTHWVLLYGTRTWTTILIGAIGVAYLTTGLIRKTLALHRYTGFAVLGFVILRVFTVELQGTDLAIRALVFAVLGAVLLGIGYTYARMQRRDAAPVKVPSGREEDGPGET